MKNKEQEFVESQLHSWIYASKYISVVQTPNQKQMKEDERKKFRVEAKASVARPFTGDICVFFRFTSVSANPPRIDKLVKNYMDLMHKPDICDGLKEIVFHDDSQVRYIHAVHYESAQYKTDETDDEAIESNVKIVIMPFSCFRHMLYCIDKFCQRPRHDNYEPDEYSLERSTRDLQIVKGSGFISDAAIASAETMDTWGRQESLLKCFGKTLFDILPFFKARQNDKLASWMNNQGIGSDFFTNIHFEYLGMFSLQIPKIPQEHGDTDLFVKQIREQLLAFDSKILHFKQMRLPVAIQFIYVPPDNTSFSKDIDNIALKVIPEIMEWFAFPKTMQQEDDVLPKNRGTEEYEIIQLPANKRYPDGCLFFSFANQMSFKSMWDEGKEILKQQVMDRSDYFSVI